MSCMINVGVSKEVVQATRDVITDILQSNKSDVVLIAALETLKALCAVNNTTIQNCSFGGLTK